MGIPWSADFSYEYFKKILLAAKSNFEFHLFCEVPQVLQKTKHRKLFLRHDIDIDLNKASTIATIEYQLGIRATYMVMLNSPTYDLRSDSSIEILQQLLSMGHEVGLHFDLDKNKRNKETSIESIESEIIRDIKNLEEIIQRPVQSISFHRPLSQFLNGPIEIVGLVNAYAKELMKWYLSDSAGSWREGEPLPKLSAPKSDLLQLLIHPIWWGGEHKNGPDRLEDFFQEKTFGLSSFRTEDLNEALLLHIGVKRSGIKMNIASGHVPESGKFNTDANALKQRIESHSRFGTKDLNEWLFKHLEIKKGNSILDIGCGTGKQTIPAAKLCGDNGNVVAFDTSQEALNIVYETAIQMNIADRITLKCDDIDALEKQVSDQYFDRVVGSYSLYYSKNPVKLIETVYNHLNSGGIFFFCGPSKDNNAELKMFHNKLLKDQELPESKSAVFMEVTGPAIANNFFLKVDNFTFENVLEFDSANALYDYWCSYNLYDPKIADDFKAASEQWFKNNNKFKTVKRVLGIRAVKLIPI